MCSRTRPERCSVHNWCTTGAQLTLAQRVQLTLAQLVQLTLTQLMQLPAVSRTMHWLPYGIFKILPEILIASFFIVPQTNIGSDA